MKRNLNIFAIALAIDVLLFDQLIKFFILKELPKQGISFISTGFLDISLEKTFNNAMAFSLPLPKLLIILVTIILIGVLGIWLKKSIQEKQTVTTLTLAAITAGAVSNLIDRIVHGGVIDYLSVSINSFTWPIFNLADTVIVVSAIILFINNLKTNKI